MNDTERARLPTLSRVFGVFFMIGLSSFGGGLVAYPAGFNGITLAFGLGVVAILFWRRINPAILILACGAMGWFWLR